MTSTILLPLSGRVNDDSLIERNGTALVQFIVALGFYRFCIIFVALFFAAVAFAHGIVYVSRLRKGDDGEWQYDNSTDSKWWFDQVEGLGNNDPVSDPTQDESSYSATQRTQKRYIYQHPERLLPSHHQLLMQQKMQH
uniref:Ion_trans domain-containing protein n=1 Tax=Ascaris lumbricoides TaxID=6252 RepID=A0A0M3IPA2_ASCLU